MYKKNSVVIHYKHAYVKPDNEVMKYKNNHNFKIITKLTLLSLLYKLTL